MDMDLINELEVSRTISVKYLDKTLEKPCERSTKLNEPIKPLYQNQCMFAKCCKERQSDAMTHQVDQSNH